jgi:DNA-directed RNA polymerase specialized sigma24 family protein
MLMTTDTRLIDRAMEGDRDAFDAVFEASFSAIYGFAARRTRDRVEAEGLTARILGRAVAALPAYAGEVPFAAWLLELSKQVEREERLRRPARKAPVRGNELRAV